MSEPNKQRKRRSPEERHRAWIAWRKRGVESYSDVCSCRIGVHPFARDAETKCCEQCAGCNQRIKKDRIKAHRLTCVAYNEFETLVLTLKPGDEIVTPSQGDWVSEREMRAQRCCHCGRLVLQRLEEWHWRNNCERKKQDTETWGGQLGVHLTEYDRFGRGHGSRSSPLAPVNFRQAGHHASDQHVRSDDRSDPVEPSDGETEADKESGE